MTLRSTGHPVNLTGPLTFFPLSSDFCHLSTFFCLLVLRLDHREVGAGVEVIQQLHTAGRGPPSPQAPSSRRLAAATPPRHAGAVEKRG